MKKRLLGILLSTVLAVTAMMNPMITEASGLARDISQYRSADGNHTVPTDLAPSDDVVFAGWYTDDTYSTPISENRLEGTAVPKWVDKDVFGIKWQVTAGTTTVNSDTTDLRLITTVDSTAYHQVGFVINDEAMMSNTVYNSIQVKENGVSTSYYADETFHETSKYFVVSDVLHVPNSVFTSAFLVKPQWKTLDGTIVTGPSRSFAINDALNVMRSATVTTNATGIDALANVADGDVNTGSWRQGTDIQGDYIEFTWANPVSVNKLIMTVTKARNSAPTAWRIQVSKDGESNWTEVASVFDIVWKELGDVKETQELTFAYQKSIKGIRIYIDAANLIWGGYTIQEIEAYLVPNLNYARVATLTTNAKMDRLESLADGDVNLGNWRSGTATDIEGKDYIEFNWVNPVSVNKLIMTVTKARNCAPTAWRVQVSGDGESNWVEVASVSDVTWRELGDVKETKELTFPLQENIKGIRVYIDAANLIWGGYTIQEIEIYNDTIYYLDWCDEFNGTELDTDRWLPEFLPHNTPVAEGAEANYEISDGSLKLILDENTVDYYTGEKNRTDGGQIVSGIQTFEKNALHMKSTRREVETFNGYKTQYGYFEARLKIPRSAGGGTAGFWMVGCEPDTKKNGLGSTQTAEIDIVETFFNNPRKYEPKLHPWSDPDLEEFYEHDVILPGTDDDYYDEFHTYGVDWTPESLVFYVDGVEVSRTEQSPQYEMCIFLSIMASFDPDSWGGGACDGLFPYAFEVDYVRVYKNINGYPNGVTKPTEYEYSGYPMIQSEVYTGSGDPAIDLDIHDFARNATLTTTGRHVNSLDFINGAGYNAMNGTCSVDNPKLPVEYTFTWDSPQNVDMLNLYSYVANGQAPTVIKLQVQKEGEEWKAAGEYEIEWQLLTSTPEYAKLPVRNGVGITALKVIVEDANLMWQHYVIQKIHIYKEGSASSMRPDTVTTNAAGMSALANVIDGDINTGSWRPGSASDIDGKDYIQFNWANPISVNKFVMTVTKARNCAPTAWRIQVSKDGESNWTEVTSASDIAWMQLGDVKETHELAFALQANIKGVRIYIDGANLVWGGYAINEIEFYHDPALNYALTSHVTTNTGADTKYLVNGNYDGDTWRAGTPDGDYYQFNWNSPISANQVLMIVSKARNCAPTAWRVEVSQDGETGWREVASISGIEWTQLGEAKETSGLTFAHQESIKGIRVYIDAANNAWNGYGIREIEIY